MESAFGIDHGEIAKYDREKYGSPGRIASGAFAPGIHGAVAGREGKKLHAAGSELAGSFLGLAPGAAAATALANTAGYYKKQPKSKTHPKRKKSNA